MENPLERGTVGRDGNTLVTNYAWLQISFGDFIVTNIPLNSKEYNETFSYEIDNTTYTERTYNEHALHMSGYNCYVSSFSCTRAVPNGVEKFWNDSGGGLECQVTIFDPTFVQFENMIMQSVKNQKVHCIVSYGISSISSGQIPEPFYAHAFVYNMSESVLAEGSQWELTLKTIPAECFDKYPVIGKEQKKETVYKLGKGTDNPRISDLVIKLLEEEGWNGFVIETEILKKTYKIPTKDFSSRIDLIRFKLAPMAKCADDKKKDLYHIMISLNNTVYFMPSNMTLKEAMESKLAKGFGNFREEYTTIENKSKSTIEQLNMQDYISEQDGALVFKYGFQNSIVQSLSINYDCMAMITQFFYQFSYEDESGKTHEFKFPDFDDSLLKQKDKRVLNRKIHLYEHNEDDAKEMAKTIVRKLQIVGYQGSAVLLNWPYVMPCQEIRFEYLIPNGSKMALKLSNNVGEDETAGSFDNKPQDAKNINTVYQYDQAAKFNQDNQNKNKNTSAVGQKEANAIDAKGKTGKEKDKNEEPIEAFTNVQEEIAKSKRSKHALQGNKVNSDLNKDADYRSNIGIPAGLTSWSDTHKQSTTYYVKSIKDTIQGGIMTTELELTGLFADDFPQLNNSL